MDRYAVIGNPIAHSKVAAPAQPVRRPDRPKPELRSPARTAGRFRRPPWRPSAPPADAASTSPFPSS